MKPSISARLGGILLLASLLASAQQAKPGMLSAEELKKVVPSTYFFRGQSGAVQLRNSAGFRAQDGKLVLAGFVDTSGYAADLAEKYQGFLITELKLDIEGSGLAPGQYGFGFTKDGKFGVMDVGANDLLGVTLDPNVQIQESKAGSCDIRAGRRPHGEQLLRLIAEYQSRSGATAETGNARVSDGVWEGGADGPAERTD